MTDSKSGVQAARFDERMRTETVDDTGFRWYTPDEAPFALAGFAWFAQDRRYRRLPLHPSHPLPEAVDQLANCPAGGQVRFCTDATRIAMRVRLAGPAGMDHMPATGQCGFDLYVGAPGAQRYLATTRFQPRRRTYQVPLLNDATPEMRQFTLNFPLYQGVKEVRIGLNPAAQLLPPAPFADDRPVVIYGSSITQGGCASRPGMAYTNILSRRLNREVINLGFSGSGRGEPEVAHVMSEIPHPACLVLDYEANCLGAAIFQQTLPAFVDILRAAHPTTPLLLVSKIRYALEILHPQYRHDRLACKALQQALVEKRQQQGDQHIAFLDGEPFLGEEWDECAVDGVHPTDLGFFRMANALAPVVEGLIV